MILIAVSRRLIIASCPIFGEVSCVFLVDANEAEKQEELHDDKADHTNFKKRAESLRLQAEANTPLTGKKELF